MPQIIIISEDGSRNTYGNRAPTRRRRFTARRTTRRKTTRRKRPAYRSRLNID